MFFSSSSAIYEVSQLDPRCPVHAIHQGNVRGLLVSADYLVYVDADAHQVKMKNRNNSERSHVAGSGRQATQNGSSKPASFAQPMILCREGKTIFLTDLAASKVVMIVAMEGTQAFLRSLNELIDSMGEHMKALQNITKNCTNGPGGTVSAATISSVQLLQKGLISCEQWISRLIPSTAEIDMNLFVNSCRRKLACCLTHEA